MNLKHDISPDWKFESAVCEIQPCWVSGLNFEEKQAVCNVCGPPFLEVCRRDNALILQALDNHQSDSPPKCMGQLQFEDALEGWVKSLENMQFSLVQFSLDLSFFFC